MIWAPHLLMARKNHASYTVWIVIRQKVWKSSKTRNGVNQRVKDSHSRQCLYLKWFGFDRLKKEISQDLNHNHYDSFGPNDGYHPPCYNAFTLKAKLLAAEKRKANYRVTERKTSTPTKVKRSSDPRRQHLASATTSTCSQKRAENLLPEICLICRKNKR